MNATRVNELKESIARFESTIATFDLTREEIIQRRCAAPDQIMELLDERLKVNTRTVECLRQAVELAKQHLKVEESRKQRRLPKNGGMRMH